MFLQASHVFLLHPIITTDLINCVIVPAKPSPMDMIVVYKDELSRNKRHPVIESVVSKAVPLVNSHQEGDVGDLLMQCYYNDKASDPDRVSDSGFDCGTDCCDEEGAEDWDTIDSVGRGIFYSSLCE